MKLLRQTSQRAYESVDKTCLVFPRKPFQDGSLFATSSKYRHGVEKLQCRDNEFIMRTSQIGVQMKEVIRR